MMAEGSETPGGESGRPPGRSEGDLLAERRARRAVDGGEAALIRRAEAAEATVHTLERHVHSLQQRLREAEEEQARLAQRLEEQRAAADAGDQDLRRATQREYAEQQLRLEADEHLAGVKRQLSEAEQTLAAERAALARTQAEVGARLGDLERRAEQVTQALEAERTARERAEAQLADVRAGHGRMEELLLETKGLLSRLVEAVAAERADAPAPAPGPQPLAAPVVAPSLQPGAGPPQAPEAESVTTPPQGLRVAPSQTPEAAPPRSPGEAPAPAMHTIEIPEGAQGAEMAAALAAAVERLRARAETVPDVPPPAAGRPAGAAPDAPPPPAGAASAEPEGVAPTAPGVSVSGVSEWAPPDAHQGPSHGAPATPSRKPHKHSLSLIARWRIRRKQRKQERLSRRAGA